MQHTAHTEMPKTVGFAHPPRNVAALGIEPGMMVADFGSGSGTYVLLIAEWLAGSGRVYAIDIQRDLLRRIKNEALQRGHRNVEILWSDLGSPGGSKIGDRKLDLVLISNLLFQIENKETLIAEAKRVLRSGGRLVVIDWSDSFGGMGPIRQDVVKKEKALELVKSTGLELAREFEAGAHHYGLIFRKP